MKFTGFLLLCGLLFFTISCASYQLTRLHKRISPGFEKTKTIENPESFLSALSAAVYNEKSYPAAAGKTIFFSYSGRYYSDPWPLSPVEKLNHDGVKYSLAGKLNEAETIFTEILLEDDKFAPALNNLAIVNELMNDFNRAFSFYFAACAIDPENEYFATNFKRFCDDNPDPVK